MEKAWLAMTVKERQTYIQDSRSRLDFITDMLNPEDFHTAETLYCLGRSGWDVDTIQDTYCVSYIDADTFLFEQSIRKLDWVRSQYQQKIHSSFSYWNTIHFATTVQTFELLGEPEQNLIDFIQSYQESSEKILEAGRKELSRIAGRELDIWQASFLFVSAEYEIANESNPNTLYSLGLVREENEQAEAILDLLSQNIIDRFEEATTDKKLQQELKEELEQRNIIFPDDFWKGLDNQRSDSTANQE